MKDSAGAGIPGGRIAVYSVADWELSDGSPSWKLTEAYTGCGIPPENLEHDGNAAALAAYTRRYAVAGSEKEPDEEGKARFTDLPAGLYLVVQIKAARGYNAFSPFLLALPHYNEAESRYSEYVTASPKTEPVPAAPDDPDPPTPPDRPDPPAPPGRPDPPTPADNPSRPEKPVLSRPAEPALSDVGDPTDDPYDAELSEEIDISDSPARPLLPQTGQLWWPVPVLLLGGIGLMALAHAIRKRSDDNGGPDR